MRKEAILLRRGDKIPENAREVTDAEMLNIQLKRLDKFQPQREVWPIQYSTYVLSACTSLSGLIIANTVRRNFRLGGLRRTLTYVPTVALSGLFSGALHDMFVKQPILMGREGCPVCTTVKSGALQLSLGVIYTYSLALLTCIPTARDYYTLPFPDSAKTGSNRQAYMRLLRQVSPKSSWMLGLCLVNVVIGAHTARRELQIFARHLSQPPSQMKQFLQDQQEMIDS